MKRSVNGITLLLGSLLALSGCEAPPEPTPQAEQAPLELTPEVAKQALLEMFSRIQGKEIDGGFGRVNLVDFANAEITQFPDGTYYVERFRIHIGERKYSIEINGPGSFWREFAGSFEQKNGRWIATEIRMTKIS